MMAALPHADVDYAIGDVHGRHDLLLALLDAITADAARSGGIHQTTFLGDLIDRGADSRAVLETVRETGANVLLGNHDAMLLDTLDGDQEAAYDWLRNGGLATLADWGHHGGFIGVAVRLREILAELSTQADFRTAVAWLRTLPTILARPDLVLVHAGIDPYLPLQHQERDTLLWTRSRDFLTDLDLGFTLVHGHTVTRLPTVAGDRVAIDTGACQTHRLTAARIDTGTIRFIQAEGAPGTPIRTHVSDPVPRRSQPASRP